MRRKRVTLMIYIVAMIRQDIIVNHVHESLAPEEESLLTQSLVQFLMIYHKVG